MKSFKPGLKTESGTSTRSNVFGVSFLLPPSYLMFETFVHAIFRPFFGVLTFIGGQ